MEPRLPAHAHKISNSCGTFGWVHFLKRDVITLFMLSLAIDRSLKSPNESLKSEGVESTLIIFDYYLL